MSRRARGDGAGKKTAEACSGQNNRSFPMRFREKKSGFQMGRFVIEYRLPNLQTEAGQGRKPPWRKQDGISDLR